MTTATMTPTETAGRAGDQPTLRLTRRGRLVIFFGCLAVLCAGLVLLAGAALGAGESGPAVPTQEVTVHSGDTLWEIATQVDPEADPREVVEEIRELNDFGGALQAGDKIDVPAAG